MCHKMSFYPMQEKHLIDAFSRLLSHWAEIHNITDLVSISLFIKEGWTITVCCFCRPSISWSTDDDACGSHGASSCPASYEVKVKRSIHGA